MTGKRERRTFAALLALLLSSALVSSPAASAQTEHLAASVRYAILSEHFHAVFRVSEIPSAVLAAAAEARGPKLARFPFELAEPGAPFQSTDVVVGHGLPGRRLVAEFASVDYWIVHYEVGGVAHTYHVAVFAMRGGHPRFVWHAFVQRKLTGIDDLRNVLRNRASATFDDTYTQLY